MLKINHALIKWLFGRDTGTPESSIDDIEPAVRQQLDGTVVVEGSTGKKFRFLATKEPDADYWSVVSGNDAAGERWFQQHFASVTFTHNGSFSEMRMTPADEVLFLFSRDIKYTNQ